MAAQAVYVPPPNQGQPQQLPWLPQAQSNVAAASGIPQDPTQSQPQQSNGWASWLPLVGGILGGVGGAFVPIAGETGLSEVAGGAAGQGIGKLIENAIEGNPDVTQGAVGETVAGGIGGLTGLGIGNILSKTVGKYGVDLALSNLNLGASGVNKFASKFAGEAGGAQGFVNRMGIAGQDVGGLTEKALNPLNQAYSTAVKKSGLTINPSVLDDNFFKSRNALIDPSVGGAPTTQNQALADKMTQEYNLFRRQNGIKFSPKTELSTSTDPIDANIVHNYKSAFDAQTSNSQFMLPPDEATFNRNMGSVYRGAINDAADQSGYKVPPGLPSAGKPLSGLGQDLNKLNFLQEIAQKRQGIGQSILSLPNLLRKGVGAAVGGVFGNPLAGVVGEQAIESALQKPVIAGGLSRILGGLENGINTKTGAGIIGGASTLAGGALNTLLFAPPASGGSSNQEQGNSQQQPGANLGNQNQSQINNNVQHNNPILAQNSSNVNTTGQSGGIQSFDGKTSFPNQLPQPVSISNTVPGQTYTNDQYEQDSQKIAQAAVQNAYNPAALDALKVQQQSIDNMHNSNTQRVDMYLQQQGLDGGAQDFVRTANPQWNALTQLHELLKTNGGQNLFQSFIQADPAMQTILAAKDPKYALMFNLLGQQKLAQARLAQGGVPRAYDLALSRLGAGQTAAANSTILEYAMNQFLNQYQQYAPLYGLSLSQGSGSGGNNNTNVLPQLLNNASAQQQQPQSQIGGLYQTLNLPNQ